MTASRRRFVRGKTNSHRWAGDVRACAHISGVLLTVLLLVNWPCCDTPVCSAIIAPGSQKDVFLKRCAAQAKSGQHRFCRHFRLLVRQSSSFPVSATPRCRQTQLLPTFPTSGPTRSQKTPLLPSLQTFPTSGHPWAAYVGMPALLWGNSIISPFSCVHRTRVPAYTTIADISDFCPAKKPKTIAIAAFADISDFWATMVGICGHADIYFFRSLCPPHQDAGKHRYCRHFRLLARQEAWKHRYCRHF